MPRPRSFARVPSLLLSLTLLVLVVAPVGAAARPRKPGPRGPAASTTLVRIEAGKHDVVLELQGGDKRLAAPTSSPGESGAGDGAGARAGAREAPVDAEAEAPLPLDEGKWDPVCSSPCDSPMRREGTYRITGFELTTSSTFVLPPNRPEVTLRVAPGASRWYWTGVIVAALGGSLFIGGVGPPLLLGGSFSTAEKVIGGAGTVMLAVGVPLWLLNRTTVNIF